jgi:hypothetical protein
VFPVEDERQICWLDSNESRRCWRKIWVSFVLFRRLFCASVTSVLMLDCLDTVPMVEDRRRVGRRNG